jgi:hypothetical protein
MSAGNDHVRATLRRGFQAYFQACMPGRRRVATSPIRHREPQEEEDRWENLADVDGLQVRGQQLRRTRRRGILSRRRHRSQSPMPPMPDRKIRGFFSGECDGELEDCAVCFGEIKVGERIIVLNCSDTAMHTYHERCIAMWLKDNETCPVCRANVL